MGGGVGVGTALGAEDGKVVGVLLAVMVGAGDVGPMTGAEEGAPEGLRVGNAVGFSLAVAVGAIVGAAVGSNGMMIDTKTCAKGSSRSKSNLMSRPVGKTSPKMAAIKKIFSSSRTVKSRLTEMTLQLAESDCSQALSVTVTLTAALAIAYRILSSCNQRFEWPSLRCC